MWVLTGDKIETAINIGFSCKLLDESLRQIFIKGIHVDDVRDELIKGERLVGDESNN